MKNTKEQLKTLATVRGLERERHFEQGGTLHDWRGGIHTVTPDKQKCNSKKACRGKVSL